MAWGRGGIYQVCCGKQKVERHGKIFSFNLFREHSAPISETVQNPDLQKKNFLACLICTLPMWHYSASTSHTSAAVSTPLQSQSTIYHDLGQSNPVFIFTMHFPNIHPINIPSTHCPSMKCTLQKTINTQ